MSDTPRTDAVQYELLDEDTYTSWLETTQFARQLERELNAANDKIKRLEEAGDRLAGTTPPSSDRYMAWIKAKKAKP